MDPLLTLLRLAGSLVVIVALVVVVLRFVLPRLPGFRPAADARLRVVEVRPLDRQSKVVLLRVDDREILAAFGPAGAARLDAWAAATSETGAEEAEDAEAAEAPAVTWIGAGVSRGHNRPGDGAA